VRELWSSHANRNLSSLRTVDRLRGVPGFEKLKATLQAWRVRSVLGVRHHARQNRTSGLAVPLTGSDFGNGRLATRRNASCEGALSTNVPMLIRWVGPDHEKITARLDSPMPSAYRQNGHVAWPEFHLAPVLATKDQERPPSCESEDVVRGRVVVVVMVDSVAPLRRPSVARERSFEIRARVASVGSDDSPIQQHRQWLTIGYPPVRDKRRICGSPAPLSTRAISASAELAPRFPSIALKRLPFMSVALRARFENLFDNGSYCVCIILCTTAIGLPACAWFEHTVPDRLHWSAVDLEAPTSARCRCTPSKTHANSP
jgi:hypothetical protein